MYHYTACGLDNIYLANGFRKTNSPSGDGVSIHNIDGLHEAIARGLISKEAPLLAKEFRFLRIELDLSQKALGKLLDKSDQMIAKWEKETNEIPVLADKALRDLYMESVGEGVVAGLLGRFAELDRQIHEITLKMVETSEGWSAEVSEAV